MELETLEVLLDINTERVQETIERVLPQIESMMSRFEQISGRTMGKTEKNLDIDKGATNFSKQLEKMDQHFEKTMTNLEKTSKTSGDNVGNNFASGVRKARPRATKEIDAMVNEINAKMGQAKAAQEKVAYLKSQRQSASSSGDTGKVVKYDEQIARAQAQMSKFGDQAKGMANTIKREFDAVPSSLDTITKSMAQNEGQIESMRKRIKTLKAEYADQRTPVGSFSGGFKGYEDTPQSLKTSAEIQKQSTKMGKLINDNDRLQREYAQTEDRANSLRKALMRINNTMSQSSIQTGSAANGAAQTGSGLKQSERAVSKYGGVFNRMSNAVSHGFGGMGNGLKTSLGYIGKFGSLFSSSSNKVTAGNRNMMGSTNAFGQSMKYLLPSLVVYQLIGGAITKLASGMMSALKTNDQFSASLNQIKVNLMTAFYPIYTAILPAVNALMSALAQLTGQFASFIAGLFGTNYEAAKAGASSLYDNIQALDETGSSADKAKEKVKKFQKQLLGFDEINKLTFDDDEDKKEDSKTPSIDFDSATGAYTTPKWMLDIQKLLKNFFKPFQDAWRNQGQKVIDAWKYALGEVIGLASAIGRSFMEVWTNGTGQLFIENLLILLADILNIIGDIAGAFKRAWEDDGRGTRLIQSFFDMWNRILELLHEIAVAFRNAWNDGRGESIAANILEIYTNIFDTVGNLAEQFKKAWKEGSIGESIFGTILDVADDLLETVNDMTGATAKWAKKLDFSPLLKSIDKILKAIQPITESVFDGLAWAWENLLLPLAGFVIEDVLPAFFDYFSAVLKIWNGVIEIMKPLWKWLWDKVLSPILGFTGAVFIKAIKTITGVLSDLGDWINENIDIFHKFIEIGTQLVEGLFKGILGDLQNVGNWLKENLVDPIVNAVKKFFGIHSPSTVFADLGAFLIQGLLGGILDNIGEVLTNLSKFGADILSTISGAASKVASSVSEKWGEIKKNTSEAWGKVSEWSSKHWSKAKETVTTKAKEIASNVSTKWSELKKNTQETWDAFSSKVVTKAQEAKDKALSAVSTLKTNISDRWNAVKKNTSEKWDEIKNKVANSASSAKEKASTAFSNLKTNMNSSLNSMKETASSVFGKIGDWASGLGSKIGKGLSGGVESVKKGAGKIFNGMVSVIGKGVNGVISGINWVLGKVGAGKSKLAKWEIPTYATGTNYHPGGMALVNDGLGSHYQEAYHTPDGRTGVFPAQRNLMVNLPKGTSVLSGPRTAKMFGGPAYANGVGDWFKEKWDGVKEMASDIWSYASNPGKLLNAAISKFVNLSGAVDPALSMAKGSVGTLADGALSWVKSKFDTGYKKHQEELNSSGTFNGAVGSWGVYQYLIDIAQKAMNKYPGMRITSGYRPGDPHSHGKRQAIDIAYPASMNGSSAYMAPANWVFEQFANKVAYVITQGKVRDRKGMSGTGASGSWVRWPANDHYDHLHINGSLGAGDIKSDAGGNFGSTGGYSSSGGDIVDRAMAWRGAVSNPAYVSFYTNENNAMEGGPLNALGGYLKMGDIAVDPRYHKLGSYLTLNGQRFHAVDVGGAIKGRNRIDVFVGSSQARAQALGRRTWQMGYENGGLVTRDGLYRMGEGNKKEMVIPLEKPQRAAELIQQAIEYLGLDMFGSTLTLPEIFQGPSFTPSNSTFNNNDQMNYQGGGMQDFTSAMVTTLMNAISAMGATPTQAPNGDIVINIGGKEFGRIAVKEINKYHQQLGYTELNI
ncbi:3D domain-containing protein [Enterococcus asini]|uniref:3D domain-containing protein n=1 Tax=Enterococcus asini TaxID=57732 RepID=UPI00241E73A6|nr:3D domain-containing protein [Enterococcus asini]